MSRKTKEISEYDRPIQDLENPDDEVDSAGPNMNAERWKDEVKKGERRKRQVGRRMSGLERKPECLGKQKRCQYVIALLRFCVSRQTRWSHREKVAFKILDFRPWPRTTRDFRWGGQPIQTNPTGLSYGGSIR
jgi:hypothetical protein